STFPDHALDRTHLDSGNIKLRVDRAKLVIKLQQRLRAQPRTTPAIRSVGGMRLRRCPYLGFSLFLVVGAAIPRAQAQARIGEAVVVRNEVVNVVTTSQINVGDGVLRDETVRTGIESATRLVMADSTNVSLGPNATLKLDRSVF